LLSSLGERLEKNRKKRKKKARGRPKKPGLHISVVETTAYRECKLEKNRAGKERESGKKDWK